MPKFIDLTGQRFGKLTVLTRVEDGPGHNKRWLCLCDCGRRVVVFGHNLKKGTNACVYCLGKRVTDKTGNRYGRLIVIGRATPDNKGRNKWRCRCDCGNETIVRGEALENGTTRSCGCINKERWAEYGKAKKTHGHSRTPIYCVWSSMKQRCQDKNNWAYQYYGGRGINVCAEWNSFSSFYAWAVSNGYDENAPRGRCTLDRIDNNGDYCPENCRWITLLQQANNKRNNVRIEFNGESHTFTQWSEITGIPRETLRGRYYRGWNAERILNAQHDK